MAGETTMANPAEYVPTDGPPGKCQRHLGFGTEGLGMPRTALIRTVNHPVNQTDRPIKRKQQTMPMRTDDHLTIANAAPAIHNTQLNWPEDRLVRPVVTHGDSPPCKQLLPCEHTNLSDLMRRSL